MSYLYLTLLVVGPRQCEEAFFRCARQGGVSELRLCRRTRLIIAIVGISTMRTREAKRLVAPFARYCSLSPSCPSSPAVSCLDSDAVVPPSRALFFPALLPAFARISPRWAERRREGVAMGLFRGMGATMLREPIQFGIYYPSVREKNKENSRRVSTL